MVERRHRRRSLLLLAIPLAALAFVVSVRVFDTENPCRTPRAAPSAERALMPAGLSFDGIGTVTRVRKDDRHVVTVNGFTTKPIDEVSVLIQDAVVAAGYRPAGMDSEGGVEAEVFFTTGRYAAGQARVRWAGCDDGRSDIELVLLDRDAAP